MIDKTKLPPCSVVCEDEGLYIIEPAPAGGDGFVPLGQRAEADRPREKLMAKGAEALTNAELFAILIGNGTRKKTAVELMQDILHDCGNRLDNLNRLTIQDLMAYSGIGEAKALSIIAAAELGRRRAEEKAGESPMLVGGEAVYSYMLPRVRDLSHEQSWALLLNSGCRLIKCVQLSTGGLSSTHVDVRILLKHALLHNATGFVLVHNHPSGNVRPSPEDKALTVKAKQAADIMDMKMLDHVIVTDGGYYSFAAEGRL